MPSQAGMLIRAFMALAVSLKFHFAPVAVGERATGYNAYHT
jgi:hypothetical protein